jgi:hypothetical protein
MPVSVSSGHAGPDLLFDSSSNDVLRIAEGRLQRTIEALCAAEGMSYLSMTPIQRLFLTHYRCFFCKMMPLYELDLSSRNRAKCGRCRHLVSLTGGGKYGKIRKRLAMAMYDEEQQRQRARKEGRAGGARLQEGEGEKEGVGAGRDAVSRQH